VNETSPPDVGAYNLSSVRPRFLLGLCLAVFFAAELVQTNAQTNFPITALPTDIGSWQRAYVGTDVDVSTRLGQPGGPQRWDFSYAPGATDALQRRETVAVSDGGHGASYPNATYAERLTSETTGATSWSYYRVAAASGRTYYGFFDEVANPTCPGKVFAPPTTDLPAVLSFGQTWSRTLDFYDCIDAGFLVIDLAITFTASAEVDAYGTLVLPDIGEVPAVRVNEVHTYDVVDETLGIFDQFYQFRNYYWLVPGIGKAVDLLSNAQATVPPANLSTARSLWRVFQSRPWTACDLRLRIQDTQALLTWRPETETSGYQIEMRPDLSPGSAWQFLTETTGHAYSEPFLPNAPQRLFRVLVKP
jgi:hypothetical protein